MKAMYETRGWMGVELDQNDDGSLRVAAVIPGSPAEKAGLKADDDLISVNGATLSKDANEKVMSKEQDWTIGRTLTLGVKRGDDVSTVKVALARIPEALLAKMIETHVREHHEIARN